MGRGGCESEEGVKAPKMGTKEETKDKDPLQQISRKWWNRGGMHIYNVGGAVNIIASIVYLVKGCTEQQTRIFLTLLLANVALAFGVHQMRTRYCVIAGPVYYTSFLLAFYIGSPVKLITLGIAISIAKVSICMSVCLHRYSAHTAFKCGPVTQLFVVILGCLANQGGPLWWASMHRCHHKYCDKPRDPHAAVQVGTERAIAFFEFHEDMDEEFAPRHLEQWYLRLLDTWASLVVSLELILAYSFLGGRAGLYVAFLSGWLSQSITLWFNVCNHPAHGGEQEQKICKAADWRGRTDSYYPLFQLLDKLYPLFKIFVAERAHQHHHDYPLLAKREKYDVAYFCFIKPLEILGLVWDVQVLDKYEF